MSALPVRPCVVCQTETNKRCEVCKEAHYCCREHQVQDWKAGHKRVCSAKAKAPFHAPPDPAAWAVGMKKAEMYEWFVDCYRMRIDDMYVWGGGTLNGLYNEASGLCIVEDFAVFCRLAVRNNVIPAGFAWSKATRVAAKLLPFAFEKSDAKEKYGGENVFSSMMGGRSLRLTGEMVYGTSCMVRATSPAAAEEEQAVNHGLELDALTGKAPPLPFRDLPRVTRGPGPGPGVL